MLDRLDRLQQRYPPAGFVIAVVYKYVDDQAAYLAALISYYALISVFPLLLLLTTVVGVILAGHPDLQEQILDSALSQFPVIGDQLRQPEHLSGGLGGVIVGVTGALYGALGIGQAAQHAMHTVWAIPRSDRPDPFLSRFRSVILLIVMGVALVGTTILSAMGGIASSFGIPARSASLVAAVIINAVVFSVAYRVGTARKLSLTQVAVGSMVMAIVWQLLQSFGAVYVTRVVQSASVTNSVFAVVLGVLAFLYLASVAFVFCAEINAVRVKHLYPRALLGPFTDDATLTTGDRRSYTEQAKAQRLKGFQRVEVTFEEHDTNLE